jgi:hypothetical protein
MRQKQKTLRIAVATLSQAEVAVFKCILRGLSADAIANRLFTDPGMHRACAEYAMSVCPFLNGDIRQMATAHKNAAEITTNEAVSPVRPTTFGYLETANYVLATYDGEVYIHPSPGTIRWVKERV